MLFLLLGYHLRVEILIGAGQLARKFFTTINITVCIRILNNSYICNARGTAGINK